MEIMIRAGQRFGHHKVAISGAMTIYDAAAAKEKLLRALDAATEIEVDLSDVDEIDTAGVQLLSLLKREAVCSGKGIAVTGQNPAVLEVFFRYGLASYFADAVARNEGNP